MKVLIIAEIGSNWEGSITKAKKIIKECKKAGADAVKFQMWRASDLYDSSHPNWKEIQKSEITFEKAKTLKKFADEQKIKPWNYINGGFQIVNKNHKQLFQDIIKFYWENSDKLLHAQKEFKVGTDQTPINYLLKKFNVDLKILPSCYDLQDLFRKNLLYISGYSWWEDKLDNLYNSGWIYHFNAIPQNQYNRDSAYWMKRVFEELYGE